MLRLSGGQVESLFDMGLPVEVRELPADLAVLDRLLAEPALLAPVEQAWEARAREIGRPTIPIERLVRLMVVKQRSGWGYETLVREVSDSLHLRRFCRIALTERVPDESTVRKLVRRLGCEVIDEICRVVIAGVTSGERRFVPRAARIDSTVVEADVRYPTDIALAGDATKSLARTARAAKRAAGLHAPRVCDRSRSIARRERKLNRTLAARTGQGKATALRLTGEAGALVERSVREARRLAERLRERARGRGAQTKLAAARRWRSWPIAPAPSRIRSASDWSARRSPTAWFRWPIPTRGPSARASCASRPSSATSFSSLRSARTRAVAPAA